MDIASNPAGKLSSKFTFRDFLKLLRSFFYRTLYIRFNKKLIPARFRPDYFVFDSNNKKT